MRVVATAIAVQSEEDEEDEGTGAFEPYGPGGGDNNVAARLHRSISPSIAGAWIERACIHFGLVNYLNI